MPKIKTYRVIITKATTVLADDPTQALQKAEAKLEGPQQWVSDTDVEIKEI